MHRLMGVLTLGVCLGACATTATNRHARRNASLNVARVEETKDPVRSSIEKERTEQQQRMEPAQLPRTAPLPRSTPEAPAPELAPPM